MAQQTRRDFLKTVALGATGMAAASLSSPVARAAGGDDGRRPNVLFVFCDQLRANVLGPYGGTSIATPHIDRLAKEGVTFTNALSTCPLCGPYRAMLMAGRSPMHTGYVLNALDLNERHRYGLGDAFRDAGYDTGFIGKMHLAAGEHAHPDFLQGRAAKGAYGAWMQAHPLVNYVPPGTLRMGFAHWEAYNLHTDYYEGVYFADKPDPLRWPGYETDALTDMAIAFMRKRQSANSPFFLVLAPHPPHQPWDAAHCPRGYLEGIPEDLRLAANVRLGKTGERRAQDILKIRIYHAMVKNIDDNIGRILRFLDESGLARNTMVVFTSDHGEMGRSHGRFGKTQPYAESVDVPLVVRWPGRAPAGQRTDTLQTPVDHLPTLCSLAGIEAPSELDGVDLGKEVLGSGRVEREAVLMMNYTKNTCYFLPGREWRAVRTRRHTYVRRLPGKEELYDNTADPCQLRNLATRSGDPAPLEGFRKQLADLLAEADDAFLPAPEYEKWIDARRKIVMNALGSI